MDQRAARGIKKFSQPAREELTSLIVALEKEGFLKEPEAKKITSEIFEMRVAQEKKQYRACYAYLAHPEIILLSAFEKQTNKTPIKEIRLAQKRLQAYK